MKVCVYPWSFPPQTIGDFLTLGQLLCLIAIAIILIKKLFWKSN